MWAISNQLSYSQGGLKRWKVQQLFWTVQRSKFWRRKNNIIYYIHLSASKKGEFCISVCVYLYFYVFVFCSLVGVQGNFTWVTGKQTKFWDGLDNYWPRYLVTVQCHPLPRLELTFIFVFIFFILRQWITINVFGIWQYIYFPRITINTFMKMFHHKTSFFRTCAIFLKTDMDYGSSRHWLQESN